MRLMDKVMMAPAYWDGRDALGRVYRLPAAGSRAAELQRCTLRYILDRSASSECGELLRREPDLLVPENPFVRAPAEEFWLEWFEESCVDDLGTTPGVKLAVLVKADPDCRRGTMSFFYDKAKGAGISPLMVDFDLDQRAAVPPDAPDRFRLSHGDLPHMNRLLQHAVVRLDRGWDRALRATSLSERRRFVVERSSSIWIALPAMLTFSALLSHSSVLDQRPSDLKRLNHERGRNGRRPLLDHLEVSMRLGAPLAPQASAPGAGSRAHPRLHYVRGHPVTRAGKMFWRSPHFRGDLDRPILSRTVNVHGARSS